jgi:hypothetical protein
MGLRLEDIKICVNSNNAEDVVVLDKTKVEDCPEGFEEVAIAEPKSGRVQASTTEDGVQVRFQGATITVQHPVLKGIKRFAENGLNKPDEQKQDASGFGAMPSPAESIFAEMDTMRPGANACSSVVDAVNAAESNEFFAKTDVGNWEMEARMHYSNVEVVMDHAEGAPASGDMFKDMKRQMLMMNKAEARATLAKIQCLHTQEAERYPITAENLERLNRILSEKPQAPEPQKRGRRRQ